MSNWHPVTWLSLMLDSKLFGSSAGGAHWVNPAFHLVNALLLFLVLAEMTGASGAAPSPPPFSLASAASGNRWPGFPNGRTFCAFFSFCWRVAYARAVTSGKWQVAGNEPRRHPSVTCHRHLSPLVFFALALMSKPMAVTLPFVLLLLDFWPLRRFTIGEKTFAFTIDDSAR